MATSLPGYVTASVPNPAEKRAAWYKNTAPSYAGIFSLGGVLFGTRRADDQPSEPRRMHFRSGGGRPHLLRPLLLRAGDARHADGAAALCGGHLHLWDDGRLRDARPADGAAANRLVFGGHVLCCGLHHERPQRPVATIANRDLLGVGLRARRDCNQGDSVRRTRRTSPELGAA